MFHDVHFSTMRQPEMVCLVMSSASYGQNKQAGNRYQVTDRCNKSPVTNDKGQSETGQKGDDQISQHQFG